MARLGRIRALQVYDGTAQFLVVLREHFLARCAQSVEAVVVVFVTQQDVEVVAADVVGIRNQLLQVVVIGALVVFAHLTACAFPLAVVGIQHRGRTGFVQVERTVDGNLQTFDGRDVYESVGRQGVAFGVAGVQLVVHDGVGIADERTGQAGILAATIVHHVEAIGILHDAAVCVAHIEGIDGGNLRGECPYVTRRRTATVVGQRVVVEAGVRHVAAYLHPGLHLVVGLQAGSQTLHVRILRNTLIAQIT